MRIISIILSGLSVFLIIFLLYQNGNPRMCWDNFSNTYNLCDDQFKQGFDLGILLTISYITITIIISFLINDIIDRWETSEEERLRRIIKEECKDHENP